MKDNGFNVIERHFERLEAKLSADFNLLRNLVKHPGERGALVEQGFLEILSSHIPEGFGVTSGFVVDSLGNSSRQIDIIVYNKSVTPFVFRGAISVIPIECVIMALEIKSHINSEAIKDAAKKGTSIKQLSRNAFTTPWPFTGDITDESVPKPQFVIAGLTSVSKETVLNAWKAEAEAQKSWMPVDSIVSIEGNSGIVLEQDDKAQKFSVGRIEMPASLLVSLVNFSISNHRAFPVDFFKYVKPKIEIEKGETG